MTGDAFRLTWGASSHRGVRRALNEDSFLASGTLFLVADGMGGHEAGEVASSTAVDAFQSIAELPVVGPDDLRDRIEAAQRGVRAISAAPGRGAGTTLAGVALAELDGIPYWLVVNLGDSRTYHLSEGLLEQVSVDHSEVQEMVDAGVLTREGALTHPRRHVVTRALGAAELPEADFWYVPVRSQDRFLVCSDGLTGELPDSRIREILLGQPDPQAAADHLVNEAIVAGGRDNITVVVVDATGIHHETGEGSTVPRHPVDVADEDTLPREIQLQRGDVP